MNGGKKICQCGKFLKESVPCSFPDCLDDKVVERYTVAKLLYQNTVEACIAANWAGNVMGVAGKADAAKMVKVVEFPFHVMEGALRRSICDTNEKFSNETRPADLIFIEIDVVGGLELIHPEVGGGAMDTDLRKDVIAQISIERNMICGIGACLACACKVDKAAIMKHRDLAASSVQLSAEEDFGYALVCRDGPVFSIDEVVFDD